MTFDNGSETYVHLVSYPSCWLPPPQTTRLMLVNFSQDAIHTLVDMVQRNYPSHNVAIYTIQLPDLDNADQVDWLLINHTHCADTLVQVSHSVDLLLAQSMRCSITLAPDAHPQVAKLSAWSKCFPANPYEFFKNVIES